MTEPRLETHRLILRPLAARDVPALTDFYMSERSQYAGGHVPRSQAWRNAAAMLGHWSIRGYGNFAITLKGDGGCIGMAGPYFPDGRPETEIGWVLFEGAEGQGYAFEAATAVLAYARSALGWRDVVSYIDPENTRSIALAERLGATLDANAPQLDKPCLVYSHPEEGSAA